MKAVIPCCVALAACAAQGGDDGGAANLPNRGIAGWASVGTLEDPFVLVAASGSGERFGGPSALVVDGDVVVWFHVEAADTFVVRRAASPDGEAFGPASDALAGARDPSVARLGDDTFMMVYVDAAAGGLGLAVSDDGLSFTRVAATNLPVGVEPSLVVDGDRLIVYAAVDDTIVRTAAGADLTFGDAEVVLAPGVDCADPFGEPEPCWDEALVRGPDVRLATTATGRRVFRMMYVGVRGSVADVGFAASFDGVTWSRYAFNPVVEQSFVQESPSAIVLPDGYRLYWAEPRSSTFGGVVLGRTPESKPVETW